MKLLIETYVSIFITTLCIIICSSFINSELQINEARDFHSSCVTLIETTDFDSETILNCQKEAINRGYYCLKCTNCNETYDKSLTECPNCKSTSSTFQSGLEIKSVSNENGQLYCGNCDKAYDASKSQCSYCGKNEPLSYIQNRLYTVELKYDIKINILNIKRTGVVNGYAR